MHKLFKSTISCPGVLVSFTAYKGNDWFITNYVIIFLYSKILPALFLFHIFKFIVCIYWYYKW